MPSPLPATHNASLSLWALYDIRTYIAYSSPSCSYLMAFTKVRDCAAIHCHDGTAATILVSQHRRQSASLNMLYQHWLVLSSMSTYVYVCIVCTAEHAVVAWLVTVPSFGQHWLVSAPGYSQDSPYLWLLALQTCYTALKYLYSLCTSLAVIAQCCNVCIMPVEGGVRPDWWLCICQFLTCSAAISLTYVSWLHISCLLSKLYVVHT